MAIWNKLFGDGKEHTNDSIELIQQNITDEKAVILDVRSQIERDAGFLKGSIFISFKEISAIDPDAKSVDSLTTELIYYCH